MSSNWDKIVKLACKPKVAAPKAKYLDPIIAATYSVDGSLRDVCAALALRLRDPSTVVMHKALLVVHTMIRTGHTDNVLGFLSSPNNDVLRLRHMAGGYPGHSLSENLSSYANYLDTRVRAYKDLKHDIIRIQNENNREERMSGGDDSRHTNGSSSSRGKKLRQMTVEKGLLRETKGVQRQIDALLQCKFFLDSLDDELTLTTLRLLVKDLLILFQAGNEGVINVLEHYFEMSAVDAEESLAIYKSFCTQTEGVVEYLSIARKLSNLLNVPVPNLRHAPTKLAGALEEYLRDPNFEQNRIEYKTNKALADGKIPNKAKSQPAPSTSKKEEATPSTTAESSSTAAKKTTPAAKPAFDLLESIEESQQTMFNPQTNSPSLTWFQQQQTGQPAINPFRQTGVMPQMTGMPATQPFLAAQPTGFQISSASPFAQSSMQPQLTGMPFQTTASPFQQPFGAQPTGVPAMPFQQPFQTGIMQPQPTGFLQPQATGSNPFRQSMAFPQMNGMSDQSGGMQPRSASAVIFSGPSFPQNNAATGQSHSQSPFAAALINRPASTPITGNSNQGLKPVVSHQTGSRNPFGQPKAPSPPPLPKPATLGQIAMSAFGNSAIQPNFTGMPSNSGFNPQSGMPSAAVHQQFSSNLASALGDGSTTNPGNANMSSVASSFLSQPTGAKPFSMDSQASPQLTSQMTSTSGFSDAFSSLSFGTSTNTNTTSTSMNPPSISVTPLQPQATGFAGLKQFKPTSSFGASLMESLPVPNANSNASSTVTTPISATNTTSNPSQLSLPGSTFSGTSTSTTGLGSTGSTLTAQPTGFSSFSTGLGTNGSFGSNLFSNATPTPSGFGGTGSTVGVGLRPQMTGGGAINPFRASMATNQPGNFNQPFGGLTATPTGIGGLPQTNSSFGTNLFANGASPFKPSLATIPSFTGNPTQQQGGQPQQSTSLI